MPRMGRGEKINLSQFLLLCAGCVPFGAIRLSPIAPYPIRLTRVSKPDHGRALRPIAVIPTEEFESLLYVELN